MSVEVTLAYHHDDHDDRVQESRPTYEAARDAALARLPEGATALSYRVSREP